MSGVKDSAAAAAPFTAMAARIVANAAADFAGAVVVVAPDGRTVIDLLSLDPSHDEVAFWGQVAARVEAAKNECLMNEQAKQGGAFGPMGVRR